MHWGFGLVDEYHVFWSEGGDLANYLASDTTGCSGDKDALVVEHLAYGVHIYFDFLAWKEVFDFNFSDVGLIEVFLAVPFFDLWDDIDVDIGVDELVDDVFFVAECCHLERGYDDAFDIVFLKVFDEVLAF